MSVKSKIKRLNKEIEKLKKENNRLITESCNKSIEKSSKEELYENIIKFAITNQIGGLKGGMMVDFFSVDKMKELNLSVESSYFKHAYTIRVSY